MHAIIIRGLYILNPLYEGQKHLFKETFLENSAFMYGQYSRAVYNHERVMMARVRYSIKFKYRYLHKAHNPLNCFIVNRYQSNLYLTVFYVKFRQLNGYKKTLLTMVSICICVKVEFRNSLFWVRATYLCIRRGSRGGLISLKCMLKFVLSH